MLIESPYPLPRFFLTKPKGMNRYGGQGLALSTDFSLEKFSGLLKIVFAEI